MHSRTTELPTLAIIGPSGAGKSSVIRQLYDEGLIHVNPTWTTRPPRPGEVEESLEHLFVTPEEFKEKESAGFFLEAVEMFGLPFRYGLPPIKKSEPGRPSLVMLRASLVPLFNKYFPNHIIYQIEDDVTRIQERLEARQKHGEDLGSRLSDYEREVEAGRKIADRVFVNKDLDTLAKDIKQALLEDFGK